MNASAPRATVALETSVLAQGLPWPANRDLIHRLHGAVTAVGARPCTTGCLDGELRADLSMVEVLSFCQPPDPAAPPIRKVSLANLPAVLARREQGATTVATTMLAAHRAGIQVVATGGIGGVHIRSSEREPLDESGDLMALSRIPVTVVCSGPKAILDVAATRERLETLGITLIGYRTDTLPAFYCGHSPHAVDVRCDDVTQVVEIIRARDRMALPSAILVTVPVPDSHALPWEAVQDVVQTALRRPAGARLAPAEVTPYLLGAVRDALGNRALDANIALLEQNARLAAELGVALAEANPASHS
ncbi:MAG: pseudouridine-5'-phosphate glycosidase [Rhodothermales bacterium]